MNAFTIYEKHPTADAYRVGGFYSPYALVGRDKRFSDAELAAEYWYATGCYVTRSSVGSAARALYEANVIHRFATLPHFDA